MKPLHRIPSPIAAGILAVALLASACASGCSTSLPEEPPAVDPLADARNVPAGGRVAFYIGQETGTLRELREEVYLNSTALPPPDGVTLYTGIGPADRVPSTVPDDATLYVSGIEGPPIDANNGEVDFAETLEQYDGLGEPVGLAVGLYLSDGWGPCVNGPMRALIGDAEPDEVEQWRYAMDRLITWLRDADRPVQLRIGYEFDGAWFCYEPEIYKAAFRYIKERIDALSADDVATVWQSAAYPDDIPGYPASGDAETVRARLESWYPGDDVVDWVGLSFFIGADYLETQYSCPDPSKPWTIPDIAPRLLQDAMADFARDHEKPVMIAEAAPQGFDLGARTWSCNSSRQDHLPGHEFADSQEMFAGYFDDWFAWIEDNRDVVRMVAYINADWQSYPGFNCAPMSEACPEGYWGDTRLQSDPGVLAEFGKRLRQPPFVVE